MQACLHTLDLDVDCEIAIDLKILHWLASVLHQVFIYKFLKIWLILNGKIELFSSLYETREANIK